MVCASITENCKRKLQKAVAEMGCVYHGNIKLNCFHFSVIITFVLDEGERGETVMHIDTGDATPKYQAARRTPFAARQEISKQLQAMK